MRRFGLPLYARVAVILCIVALTMVLGLFAGSWLDSPTLWSMAFFPVVILAMLAESVAATAARENVSMALWRMASTIALAALIAALSQITSLRELFMSCPELLLTVLVMIVFVSEFFDLRIFERFQPGADRATGAMNALPTIAVVRNRFPEAPPRRTRGEAARRYRRASLQPVIDALRGRGFVVEVLECDSSLPNRLQAVAKLAERQSRAGLLVLNCAGGSQGAGALAQVSTVCEMLGLRYTGPGPQAAVFLDDRAQQMDCLRRARLSVPASLSWEEACQRLEEEELEVWVRPRFCSDRSATRVSDTRQLRRSVARIRRRFGECLFELPPGGSAVTAIVLQPEEATQARVLPLLGQGREEQSYCAMTDLSDESRSVLENAAITAAATLGCRDCARVELYISAEGAVTIGRVVAIDPITRRGASGRAAELAGLRLDGFAESLLRGAWTRGESVAVRKPVAA